MPAIVDSSVVNEAMARRGLVSLYPGSGAFGFPASVATQSLGWIGPDDSTIREAARPFVRRVPPPHEANLAELAVRVWREQLPGSLWVLPKAHWAYELAFGSDAWMPGLLEFVGVAPADLADRHDGSALAFSPEEAPAAERFIVGLLRQLFGSDFLLAWPDHPAVCTVHHHKQLWWTTTDATFFAVLDARVPV